MSDEEQPQRDDVLPLYGAAGPAYQRFGIEGGGTLAAGEIGFLTVADKTRILLAFNPPLGKLIWLTPPAARRWAEGVIGACDAAEAGEAATPEVEEQIKAFLDAIPAPQITPSQMIQLLEEFQKSFRDKGACKMLTWGERCNCPLCLIDGVIALLQQVGKPPEPKADAPPAA